MKKIRIFGSGVKSRSENATAQERVNIFFEQNDDRSQTIAYGTPGLTLFAQLGATPVRAMIVIESVIYAVHTDKLYRISNAGVATLLGTLSTSSGRVGVAYNGFQIFFSDGTKGYTLVVASGLFAPVTDADAVLSDVVCFSDSFYIVNKHDTGEFHLSSSYDGKIWNALDFATTEYAPDKLVAIHALQGRLVLFGESSIEHWANTGALDFPYSRISSATSDLGLAARWSVAEFNGSLMFLAKSRQGEVHVCFLNGFSVQKVSTNDIDAIFNSYRGVADATGLSYLYNGHQFYQINFTSIGKSWLYDGSTQLWSELKTGSGRHLSEISVTHFNTIKTSDYNTGNIYIVDGDNYTDNGEAIRSSLTTRHIDTQLERFTINELQLDCETGVGSTIGQGVTPRAMLQISKDNGHTWGSERFSDMGSIGDYKIRSRWTRLGIARDWVFKISISDPVKRIIAGIYINRG
jgi:hypothetical protein